MLLGDIVGKSSGTAFSWGLGLVVFFLSFSSFYIFLSGMVWKGSIFLFLLLL